VPREDLFDRFLEGASHLVSVLSEAPQSDHVWTWAPSQKDVAFVTRHQVQEIAVHHWDVVHATGGTLVIEGDIASDAITEFLSVSVSSLSDPADPPRDPLNGRLGLRCSDLDTGWTVHDDHTPGTITLDEGIQDGTPTLSGSSSDVLLWLYSRVELDGDEDATTLGERVHALSFTD
jgi:uncharacterized protein (TIGR03083 family)